MVTARSRSPSTVRPSPRSSGRLVQPRQQRIERILGRARRACPEAAGVGGGGAGGEEAVERGLEADQLLFGRLERVVEPDVPVTGESSTSARARPGNRLAYVSPISPP